MLEASCYDQTQCWIEQDSSRMTSSPPEALRLRSRQYCLCYVIAQQKLEKNSEFLISNGLKNPTDFSSVGFFNPLEKLFKFLYCLLNSSFQLV
jgi:hypothetical protein